MRIEVAALAILAVALLLWRGWQLGKRAEELDRWGDELAAWETDYLKRRVEWEGLKKAEMIEILYQDRVVIDGVELRRETAGSVFGRN